MSASATLRAYYRLAKPGIVYGNAIAAIAGYFFGAFGNPQLTTFLSMLIGISLVIGSACAYNNVLDKDIDAQMERTKKRAVVTGTISTSKALLFATVLLVLGATLLFIGTNLLTVLVALFGHFAYVVLYGIGKRRTVHGTLIGTISGSTPPVIGYVAATGQLDHIALLLFIILVAWQMPHFYAIAIFRRDDYAKAGIPVLSIVKGFEATRRQIIFYVALFVVANIALTVWGGASLMWLLFMSLLGLYWLYLCLQPADGDEIIDWARRQFGWSLNILLLMSVMLSIDSFMH